MQFMSEDYNPDEAIVERELSNSKSMFDVYGDEMDPYLYVQLGSAYACMTVSALECGRGMIRYLVSCH